MIIQKLDIMDVNNSNVNSFNNKIKTMPAVVCFHADWCGLCKNFVPQWDKLTSSWENEESDVKIMKVECGKPNEKKEHSEIMEKYNIKGYPTILIFDNGSHTEYTGDRDIVSISNYLKTL